jgi:Rod binding domain-containing protein
MSLSVPGISGGALPPIDQANEPAVIRNGDATAKKAYQVGLSFEQVFVDQLTQELASTVSDPSGDGSSDGSSDSSGASGLMGGDSASSAYANMLPQTLTSSIMSGGGTGIALQIARSLDPALAHPVADKTQGAKS